MAMKSGLLTILFVPLLATPSLVFARDIETTSKVTVKGKPQLHAVIDQVLADTCNWCLVGYTYCCGELTECCGSNCCSSCCVNDCCSKEEHAEYVTASLKTEACKPFTCVLPS